MAKPKVLVTRRVPDAGMQAIQSEVALDLWDSDLPIPPDELRNRIQGADGLYCLLTERVDASVLAAAPGLRVVSNMAVGYDNVDVAECTRRGIPVGNTPGVLTETTADFAFTLICAAARRVVEGDRYVAEGKWVTWGPTLLMGQDLYGSTLGLIGLGRIGAAVARRASGFGMRVLYYDPIRNSDLEQELGVIYTDLSTVLREADFLSVHTPLTPDTEGLINAEALASMKSTAVLVNTARGPVVDTDALEHALREGTIAYAALDVTDPEPLPVDHPLVSLPNCIVVPHIASSSVATRNKMASMAAANLLAGLKGERLPNCVNPEVYD